jgi:hypothetical protein
MRSNRIFGAFFWMPVYSSINAPQRSTGNQSLRDPAARIDFKREERSRSHEV